MVHDEISMADNESMIWEQCYSNHNLSPYKKKKKNPRFTLYLILVGWNDKTCLN